MRRGCRTDAGSKHRLSYGRRKIGEQAADEDDAELDDIDLGSRRRTLSNSQRLDHLGVELDPLHGTRRRLLQVDRPSPVIPEQDNAGPEAGVIERASRIAAAERERSAPISVK